MVFPFEQGVMCFIEGFFLGKYSINKFVSFGAVDLTDDVQPDRLVFIDVVEPVVKFTSLLGSDDLVQEFVSHDTRKLYFMF